MGSWVAPTPIIGIRTASARGTTFAFDRANDVIVRAAS